MKSTDDLASALQLTNVQAFLRVIRAGETGQGDDAYTTLFGGRHFESFEQHPNILTTAGGYTSTAAGAYQFLTRTWAGLVQQYGFTDFSPANQDLGAVALISGRDALEDVKQGQFESAIKKCGKEWASLPGSPYGQPTRTMSQAKRVYEEYGGTYSSDTQTVPDKVEDKPMLPFLPLALNALAAFLPKVSEIFPQGEVASRNIAAATALVNVAKKSVDASNEQDLVDKLTNDPNARKLVEQAVQENWFTIFEAGDGGIASARKANEAVAAATTPLWKQPAFVITALLLPMVYMTVGAVLFLEGWATEIRIMVVTSVVSGLLSGIMGYWLGTSFGSQKKTEMMAKTQ